MTRTSLSEITWALIVTLLLGQGPSTQAQEKHDEKFGSPRATVRTLLTTITMSRSRPQFIQEAAACLDLSGLPDNERKNGGLLATELEAVLVARDIDTEKIPNDFKETIYILPDGPRIALKRMDDGRWLFDRETVAAIPKLYADAQKQLQERNREAASLNVAPAFASPRATVRTLVDAYRRQDFERILRCLDLSDVPSVVRREVGIQLANKLKQIIVRQRRIILQEIPDSNYSDPFTWLSQREGIIEVVRLPSGDRKGEWVFSRDSMHTVDKLYDAYEDTPFNEELVALGVRSYMPNPWTETELWLRLNLPAWLRTTIFSSRVINFQLYEVIGYVLVPTAAYGLHRLITWLLTLVARRLAARRGLTLPREQFIKRLKPIGRFVAVMFFRWGLLVIAPDRVLLVPLLTVLNPLVWVLGMWAVIRMIDLIGDLMEAHLETNQGRPEIKQMMWPVGSLAVKIILLVVTVFHIMDMFSWDVTAVLTGVGIGGLAFALGAQDLLKNIFGSITLIADRPFVVGESVKIGNHEVGVVEVVGLRSTHIRTTSDTMLIVPNSNLTTSEITNYGRRRFRYYATRIGLAYSTPPEKMMAFRDGILKIIAGHEATRKNKFEAAINELAASAIEVLVIVYFDVPDQHQELAAREALIFDILRLAKELDVELAYPTQTIHVVPQTAVDEGPLTTADGA
jgi:MscS family membrane protein